MPGLTNLIFVLRWSLGDVAKPHSVGRGYLAYRSCSLGHARARIELRLPSDSASLRRNEDAGVYEAESAPKDPVAAGWFVHNRRERGDRNVSFADVFDTGQFARSGRSCKFCAMARMVFLHRVRTGFHEPVRY